MELPEIPNDDLIDVMEITNKLETSICDILEDNDKALAMSALMSASVNIMLRQCKSLGDVIVYRNIFIHILDSTIEAIET